VPLVVATAKLFGDAGYVADRESPLYFATWTRRASPHRHLQRPLLRRSLRAGSGGALALVDLDRFKPINDELGHSAGDAALIRFTNLIRRELRPGDVFARLGGNEFGILFPNTSVDEATSILGRIYETLQRNPFHYDGHSLHFSASCGIGEMVPPVEETKKRIDAALYAAKNSGRGRWVVT